MSPILRAGKTLNELRVFRRVRRGLAKNLHRLEVTAALANLYIFRQRLLRA